MKEASRTANRQFFVGLARAFGGAVIFALPLFMTMEMWWLGFYLDRVRLALFLVASFPLVVGLSRYVGFRPTSSLTADIVDAVIGYGVAMMASVTVLLLLSVVDLDMSLHEIVGKVAVQLVPGAFGAVIASGQLGGSGEGQSERERKEQAGYGGELMLMAAGAVLLAFNVAPTEEMILLAFRMTEWHAIALAITSLALMHAFVYALDFKGQEEIPEGAPVWSVFLRYTVVGYAIALLVSAYVLWTFGRYEDHALVMHVIMAVVLGFPASIGAATARLIL